jgi:hypothetical protein
MGVPDSLMKKTLARFVAAAEDRLHRWTFGHVGSGAQLPASSCFENRQPCRLFSFEITIGPATLCRKGSVAGLLTQKSSQPWHHT